VPHNVGKPKHTPPYTEQCLSTMCAAKLLSVTRHLNSMVTKWNINDSNFVAVVCGYNAVGLVFEVGGNICFHYQPFNVFPTISCYHVI